MEFLPTAVKVSAQSEQVFTRETFSREFFDVEMLSKLKQYLIFSLKTI